MEHILNLIRAKLQHMVTNKLEKPSVTNAMQYFTSLEIEETIQTKLNTEKHTKDTKFSIENVSIHSTTRYNQYQIALLGTHHRYKV